AFLIIGIGLGLNTGPLLNVAVSAAPSAQASVASGIVNTARIVGATLGVAVLGALFASHAGQNPASTSAVVAGLWPPLIGGAIVELPGALAAWMIIAPGAAGTAPAAAQPITSSSGSRTRRLP